MTTPRRLSDRYELGETLGFGGMSEVHLARDMRLSRDVAIKVLRADLARDPSFYLRFRREAQNAASLNHPTIVQVYDTGEASTEAGPLPYIVMEYVDGETLRDVLRRDGTIAPRTAMAWVADVCAALDFSHKNGIVHRDMKPANVMLNQAGEIKVMDFGIARAMSDATSSMTQTAAVIGTAQYLSPEQARGETVDARSDVYSMGCVLFELLTGEPPFTGDSPVAVAYQHVREDPPTPSDVLPSIPHELDSIVLKAMSKNPANRYQTAGDMRSDLARVLGGRRPDAPVIMSDAERTALIAEGRGDGNPAGPRRGRPEPVGRQPDGKRRPWGRIVAAVAALVVVVGLIAAIAVIIKPSSHKPDVPVPAVVGMSLTDAQVALQNLGFNVRVERAGSLTVPADHVISSDPATGGEATKGSDVVLTVSNGPKMLTVPNVVGKTLADAAKILQTAGFTVSPTAPTAPSTPQQKGLVLSTNPTFGIDAPVNAPIVITVGSGPEMVRVPDVTGQQVAQAQPNLVDVGFTVKIKEVDSARPKGEVLSETPTGGSQAPKGSLITMTVSNGIQKLPVPNVVGKSATDALTALTEAGFTNVTQDRSVVSGLPWTDNQVWGQTPAAGTPTETNAPIVADPSGARGLLRRERGSDLGFQRCHERAVERHPAHR